MVRVTFEYEALRPALTSLLAYSLGRVVAREYNNRFGRRIAGAGEFGGLLITAAGAGLQVVTDIPYERDIKQIALSAGLAGLNDVIKVYVDDEAIAWFTDANTLVVRNLGAFSTTPGDWYVLVDGGSVSVSSAEGSTSKATLHLASTVAKGYHDIVVMVRNGKKAFSGKLYVP